MRIGKLVLVTTMVALMSSLLSPGPARADMSGDPNFCYVGWVMSPRYAYTEDAEGRVTQVRLGGSILTCPTDFN